MTATKLEKKKSMPMILSRRHAWRAHFKGASKNAWHVCKQKYHFKQEKNRKQEKEMRKIRFRTLFELEMFAVVFPRRQCSKFWKNCIWLSSRNQKYSKIAFYGVKQEFFHIFRRVFLWRNACPAPSNFILAHFWQFPADNQKQFCHDMVLSEIASGDCFRK